MKPIISKKLLKLQAEYTAYLLWFDVFGKPNMSDEVTLLHMANLLSETSKKIDQIKKITFKTNQK